MDVSQELRGKVVVVTGATRGIGRAIAIEAVARGAKVVGCARQVDGQNETLIAAEQIGGEGCLALKAADVSVEADVEALFDFALEKYERIDVVVNNAGINRDALLPQTAVEDFQAVLAVNLTGPFLTCRRAVQEFLAQGEGGQIVNISSVSRMGAVSQTAYAASKGGLDGLTRTIAKEYGHKGIRANLVTVGYVPTELTARTPEALLKLVLDATPLRRGGAALEIARVALFLASPRAAYINGETIHASGGLRELPR